jgi:hypothetical protein
VLSGHTVLSEIWALALVDDGVLIHFKFASSGPLVDKWLLTEICADCLDLQATMLWFTLCIHILCAICQTAL